MGLFCTFLALWLRFFFLALWGYFWGQGRFKNIFGTNPYRQSTLFLEVQPYRFVLKSAKFGAFFHFLGLSGISFGLGSCSKTFLKHTNVDYQLWFGKFSPIFKFFIRPHWAAFLPFFCPSGLFLGLGSGSTNFWDLLI